MALVNHLEESCSRKKTFFWMVTVLIGFTIKFDLLGVTSIAGGVGLLPNYYTCMLHLFNSPAVNLVVVLQQLWLQLVFNQCSGIVRVWTSDHYCFVRISSPIEALKNINMKPLNLFEKNIFLQKNHVKRNLHFF